VGAAACRLGTAEALRYTLHLLYMHAYLYSPILLYSIFMHAHRQSFNCPSPSTYSRQYLKLCTLDCRSAPPKGENDTPEKTRHYHGWSAAR
jgi:hypothetical protein